VVQQFRYYGVKTSDMAMLALRAGSFLLLKLEDVSVCANIWNSEVKSKGTNLITGKGAGGGGNFSTSLCSGD